MYAPPQRRQSLLLLLVFTGLFGWGTWQSLKFQALPLIPYILGFVALFIGFKALSLSLVRLRNIMIRSQAMTVTSNRGSAAWCSRQEIKRAGLYKTSGVFLGCDTKGRPLFFDGETHGLTLAPAGSGKTIAFSIPALCNLSLPMIVTDLKGTLAVMTKSIREKQHQQEVFCVNPAHLFADHLGVPSRYNPLQILLDDWLDSEKNKDLISDARSLALQLSPEPASIGENTFFRNGSRNILVFGFVYEAAYHGASKATLSNVLSLLRNVKLLIEACKTAMASSILNGELADMAAELHYKLTAQDTRQVDSFLEGAVQALTPFSSSGWLADSTSTCDFRFKDLKENPATVYLLADPTKVKTYGPWLSLLGAAALLELTRCQNTKRVFFLLEEATNVRIEGLPQSLTALREYGVICWLVIQELEIFESQGGRVALETLLSQTEVKQIFGASGAKTCELVSRMLGEQTIKSVNVNLGRTHYDPIVQSVSEQARRLLTPDEVRQFPDTIIFVRNMKPIHSIKTGYHEVKPWSDWIPANPFFGSKLQGKTRVRLKY